MDYSALLQEYAEVMHKLKHHPNENETRMMIQGELCILSYLKHHDGSALPGELAQVLGVSTARISRTLNNIEKKGYIIREMDSTDRRKVIVSITENGIRYFEKVHAKVHDNRTKLLEDLGETDSKELLRILNRIVEISKKEGYFKE